MTNIDPMILSNLPFANLSLQAPMLTNKPLHTKHYRLISYSKMRLTSILFFGTCHLTIVSVFLEYIKKPLRHLHTITYVQGIQYGYKNNFTFSFLRRHLICFLKTSDTFSTCTSITHIYSQTSIFLFLLNNT